MAAAVVAIPAAMVAKRPEEAESKIPTEAAVIPPIEGIALSLLSFWSLLSDGSGVGVDDDDEVVEGSVEDAEEVTDEEDVGEEDDDVKVEEEEDDLEVEEDEDDVAES